MKFIKWIAIAIVAAVILSAPAQTTPEHLYPTDDESVTLYKIQLQRQHVIDAANEKITALNVQMKIEGDKIIADHKLEGKFTFNVGTMQFDPVKDKPAEQKK